MTGCDEQQIAIERRLHGDLGTAEAAALDAHLRACQACRAYEAAARATEATMSEQMEAVLRNVDWERVRRQARSHRSFKLEDLAVSAVGVAAIVGAAVLLLPLSRERLGVIVGVCALAIAILALQTFGRLRSLGARADPAELLAEHRVRIRRELVFWRRSLWLLPPGFLVVAGDAALSWRERPHVAFDLVLVLVLVLIAAHALLRLLPRVRRELDDLERS